MYAASVCAEQNTPGRMPAVRRNKGGKKNLKGVPMDLRNNF